MLHTAEGAARTMLQVGGPPFCRASLRAACSRAAVDVMSSWGATGCSSPRAGGDEHHLVVLRRAERQGERAAQVPRGAAHLRAQRRAGRRPPGARRVQRRGRLAARQPQLQLRRHRPRRRLRALQRPARRGAHGGAGRRGQQASARAPPPPLARLLARSLGRRRRRKLQRVAVAVAARRYDQEWVTLELWEKFGISTLRASLAYVQEKGALPAAAAAATRATLSAAELRDLAWLAGRRADGCGWPTAGWARGGGGVLPRRLHARRLPLRGGVAGAREGARRAGDASPLRSSPGPCELTRARLPPAAVAVVAVLRRRTCVLACRSRRATR
eukprot:scaffold4203_cov295-Prasinococcus_capsulatus_cf.AAC.2